ncbi:MAG: hypothetical protein LBV12_10315, partial [Puniceicoccales bacterium]|nr:hypothetical protein [Puniceicoccales bacterium]
MNTTAKYKHREGKALQVIMIFLACGGVLAAAYFLTLLGPAKKTEDYQKNSGQRQEKLVEIDKASNDLWERYLNLKAFKKTLESEDMKLLEEASAMRESYVREGKVLYDPVMDQIRKELHTFRANELRTKSL